jgi:hypothetical protein
VRRFCKGTLDYPQDQIRTIYAFPLPENVEAVLVDKPIHFHNAGKSLYEIYLQSLSGRRQSSLAFPVEFPQLVVEDCKLDSNK